MLVVARLRGRSISGEVQGIRAKEKKLISPDDFDFKELFDANYPNVFRHLMLILGERAAAEDIAQETFIKLYESPPKEFTNLSAWLIKVSTNLAYNYLRSEKNRKRREAVQVAARSEAAGQEPFAEGFAGFDDVVGAKEALRALDDRDRICLVLKFSGFSYAEIARIANIKEASVGKVIARALEKFRRVCEGKR
jgi:RNA polymerase sigma factor (sigma-70 family)